MILNLSKIKPGQDITPIICWSLQHFYCNTASLHQAIRLIVYVSLFVAYWFAAIVAFHSSLSFQLLDGVPS